jgi:hypothetical protein
VKERIADYDTLDYCEYCEYCSSPDGRVETFEDASRNPGFGDPGTEHLPGGICLFEKSLPIPIGVGL